MWSNLDNELKGSSNIKSFKKNIRKKDLSPLQFLETTFYIPIVLLYNLYRLHILIV